MTQKAIVVYLGVKEQPKKELKSYTFKNLFKDESSYKNIIDLLFKMKFINKNNNNSYNWKGNPKEKLLNLKLICVLALVLDTKNYFNSNLTDTEISKALTHTFKIEVTNTYFGQVKKEYKEQTTDKIVDYSSVFHFINIL